MPRLPNGRQLDQMMSATPALPSPTPDPVQLVRSLLDYSNCLDSGWISPIAPTVDGPFPPTGWRRGWFDPRYTTLHSLQQATRSILQIATGSPNVLSDLRCHGLDPLDTILRPLQLTMEAGRFLSNGGELTLHARGAELYLATLLAGYVALRPHVSSPSSIFGVPGFTSTRIWSAAQWCSSAGLSWRSPAPLHELLAERLNERAPFSIQPPADRNCRCSNHVSEVLDQLEPGNTMLWALGPFAEDLDLEQTRFELARLIGPSGYRFGYTITLGRLLLHTPYGSVLVAASSSG